MSSDAEMTLPISANSAFSSASLCSSRALSSSAACVSRCLAYRIEFATAPAICAATRSARSRLFAVYMPGLLTRKCIEPITSLCDTSGAATSQRKLAAIPGSWFGKRSSVACSDSSPSSSPRRLFTTHSVGDPASGLTLPGAHAGTFAPDEYSVVIMPPSASTLLITSRSKGIRFRTCAAKPS